MGDEQISVVLVTAPDARTAETMASALVDQRLAACVNVVPAVTSIYRWEGQIQRDQEALMVLKVPTRDFERLRAEVVALHPYDTPEVLALEVRDGEPGYLQWVLGAVEGDR